MIGFEHYKPRTHLSISSLTAFSRCPRKYFYSSGCRLGQPDHPALAFGSAIHASLPIAFTGDVKRAMEVWTAVWGATVGDEKRNPLQAALILADYAESHKSGRSLYNLLPPPSGVLKIEDSVSDWEIPFALDIGLDVPLVGRVDCLCQHRDTGRPWALEWKTSSEMSTRFFDGFTFNPQVCAYAMALRAYGVEVEGTMVEGLKVSTAKTKAQETMLQPVFVTSAMLSAFTEWVQWAGSLLMACEKKEQFPRDISACTPYSQFGSPGYQCDYLSLCLIDDWTVMKGMYIQKEDRPFRLVQPTVNGGVV